MIVDRRGSLAGMAKGTLLIDVMGYPHLCRECGAMQNWVWAVEARALGRDGMVEAIATDQELPVEIARGVLTAADRPEEAALLGQRRDRGHGFNPNICGRCGHQESWYSLESVVIEGAHRPRIILASAPHSVAQWRELMGELRDGAGYWYVGR
ncbi:hypothetical protein [Nocardia sp. NBC_01327]|uniref:hypothetical protein n=1 Tax=Nocardia sp. NBC_01327 TaxID=2903593 RepID=UPI002E0FB866|nr:hypothetical protein OG326_21720 [Nocardia sp. NBC_01327]